ncbi:unnamed protein product [Mytilus edulis]|uniref:Uncharacterized protein n=1 Tax=Mytilus edulis TaxID=6550 RepID=A0A8S3Q1C8_MYTED|nr:unnamed protein product [Mytilus edulis]
MIPDQNDSSCFSRMILNEFCRVNKKLNTEVKTLQEQVQENKDLNQTMKLELSVYEKLEKQEGDYDTMGGFDIRDLLTEIRHLRVQLERCIETNNALRQKLEEHLLHQHSPRSHPNKDKSQSPARSGTTTGTDATDGQPSPEKPRVHHENSQSSQLSSVASLSQSSSVSEDHFAAQSLDIHTWPGTSFDRKHDTITSTHSLPVGPLHRSLTDIIHKDRKPEGNLSYYVDDPPSKLADFTFQQTVDSDLRNLFAVGKLDDYEKLKKENYESLIVLNGVEARIQERLKMFKTAPVSEVWHRNELALLKSLKGLDNNAADINKATESLQKIADLFGRLDKGKEWQDNICKLLTSSKQYLMLEYKTNVVKGSEVADHCCTFALSNGTKDYTSSCSHLHQNSCSQCEEMDTVLECLMDVSKTITYDNDNKRDDTMYTISEVNDSFIVRAVQEWKKHILRSVNQDMARKSVLENLKEDEMLVERDWAMKFIPIQYRESQSNWFGKRGLNWHVSVVTLKYRQALTMHTVIHIFDSAPQDAETSNAVLGNSLEIFHQIDPSLTNAYIRPDNAGCFHGKQRMGIKVKENSQKVYPGPKEVSSRKVRQRGKTGQKFDPEEVSQDMRMVRISGRKRFSQEEFLSATQIASYFSRLVLNKRKLYNPLYTADDEQAETTEAEFIELNLVAA